MVFVREMLWIEAFVRRSVRCGFYSFDSPTVVELVSDSDDKLFANVLNNNKKPSCS